MASKEVTNSPSGEQIHGLEKIVPSELVPHGTNSLGKKFPRNKFTGEQIPSYTGNMLVKVMVRKHL